METWQLSQPLHLRHLAIVRDMALSNKIAHYVHFTYPNFKRMVDNGEKFWEAVESLKEVTKPGQPSRLAATATPDLDEYGFPRLQPSRFQGRHNDANLRECIEAINVQSFRVATSDPTLVNVDGGSYGKL